MSTVQMLPLSIVRTERGLTVTGTRITLYEIMEYLKADWSPAFIRRWLNLSEEQINEVMAYITTHCDEIENEYQTVVQDAQANRSYWEARNRERLEQVASLSSQPEQKTLRAKLKARKTELGMK